MSIYVKILNRQIGFVDTLNMEQIEINMNITLNVLDEVTITLNQRWGVGTLERLAPSDLMAKFDAQKRRLADAIESCDIESVKERVGGMCRGWHALEVAAVAAGHTPPVPEAWKVVVDDATFHVVQTNGAASAMRGGGSAVVVTLDELCRIYKSLRDGVFKAVVKNENVFPVPDYDEEIPW